MQRINTSRFYADPSHHQGNQLQLQFINQFKMNFFVITQSLLIISLLELFLGANGGPTTDILFNSIDVQTSPGNPYFEGWSGRVENSGKTLSIKMPMKEKLPDDMMIMTHIYFAGNQIVDLDMLLCDALVDPVYAPGILEFMVPDGEFPKMCPIVDNDNYELLNYVVDSTKLPSGVPDGDLAGDITFYQSGVEPPYAVLNVKAQLRNKIPDYNDYIPKAPGFGR